MKREAFTSSGLIGTAMLLLACASASKRATSPLAADGGLATAADTGTMTVDPTGLLVTSGEIKRLNAKQFETNSGAMRAQLKGTSSATAELRFCFHGATEDAVPLASGEIRRQIGLKLRALDGCNVVYAMWRIAPTRGLNVQVKSNPSKHESSACGDSGYTTIEPREEHEVPVIEVDSEHTLRASISGKDLQVYADGKLSWLSELPAAAFDVDGPAGVRTDNGIFDIEFRVGGAKRQ